jgi:hypothetical protein
MSDGKEEYMANRDTYSVSIKPSSVLYADFRNYLKMYIQSVKRTYAFSASYRFHSLVRALQTWDNVYFTTDRETSFDILQAIRLIMARSQNKTYFSVMNQLFAIKDEYSVNSELLSRMRKSPTARRHPKSRTLIAYKRTQADVFKVADIVDATFSSSPEVKSKMIHVIEEISEMLHLDFDKIMSHPLTELRKIFPKEPFTSYCNYVRWYVKLYQVKTYTLLADYPTTWNRRLDMLNLYKSRTSPSYVLTEDNVAEQSDVSSLADNSLSLVPFKNFIGLSIPDFDPSNRKVHAFKAMVTSTKVVASDFKEATFYGFKHNPARQKYMYSHTPNMKAWYDGMSIVSITKVTNNKFEISVYAEPTTLVCSVLKREMSRMFLASKEMMFTYWSVSSRRTINLVYTDMDNFNLSDIRRRHLVKPMLNVKRSMTRWTSSIVVGEIVFRLFDGPQKFHPGVKASWMPETVFSVMSELTRSYCTLEEINSMIRYIPMYEASFLKRSRDKAEDIVKDFMSVIFAPGFSDPFTALSDYQGGFKDFSTVKSDRDDSNIFLNIEGNLLPAEMIEAITDPNRMSVFHEGFGTSDLMNAILVTTIRAVREEVRFNLTDILAAEPSLSAMSSIVLTLVKRDLKFENEEMSDLLSLLVTAAVLRSSILTAKNSKSIKFKLLSESSISTIEKGSIVGWSQKTEIRDILQAFEEDEE